MKYGNCSDEWNWEYETAWCAVVCTKHNHVVMDGEYAERWRWRPGTTLPNGVRVFNATPHPITFWKDGWENPVTVETDTIINASILEETVGRDDVFGISFVRTLFIQTIDGQAIAKNAIDAGCLVVGSIIAAQAYPGLVVAMTPAPGYERVAPENKRMNPDKFTVF